MAVTAYLEVRGPSGTRLLPLDGERVTIGRGPGNTVPLPQDGMASQLHAVIEPVAGGWCVRDLGSRNGTLLRGERILGDRALRSGDELMLGQTRVTFRSQDAERMVPTVGAPPPPSLTPRERDVLLALCRPLFEARTFTEPAATRAIAAELVVGEDAVQQHLLRLYQKFELHDSTTRRRVLLANAAIERGAVTLADIQRRA